MGCGASSRCHFEGGVLDRSGRFVSASTRLSVDGGGSDGGGSDGGGSDGGGGAVSCCSQLISIIESWRCIEEGPDRFAGVVEGDPSAQGGSELIGEMGAVGRGGAATWYSTGIQSTSCGGSGTRWVGWASDSVVGAAKVLSNREISSESEVSARGAEIRSVATPAVVKAFSTSSRDVKTNIWLSRFATSRNSFARLRSSEGCSLNDSSEKTAGNGVSDRFCRMMPANCRLRITNRASSSGNSRNGRAP